MSDTDLLFVYGTLMSTATGALGLPQRARLARESTRLGDATLAARLYDLGAYPGLVVDRCGADVVHGELLRLSTPAETLAWLDVYEGLVTPAPSDRPAAPDGEYRRETAEVSLADGRRPSAWVYVYAGPGTGAVAMSGGRWQPRG